MAEAVGGVDLVHQPFGARVVLLMLGGIGFVIQAEAQQVCAELPFEVQAGGLTRIGTLRNVRRARTAEVLVAVVAEVADTRALDVVAGDA